jgi:hypothetical protein
VTTTASPQCSISTQHTYTHYTRFATPDAVLATKENKETQQHRNQSEYLPCFFSAVVPRCRPTANPNSALIWLPCEVCLHVALRPVTHTYWTVNFRAPMCAPFGEMPRHSECQFTIRVPVKDAGSPPVYPRSRCELHRFSPRRSVVHHWIRAGRRIGVTHQLPRSRFPLLFCAPHLAAHCV